MSSVYEDIAKALPTIIDGWCDLPKAIYLASVVVATRPNVVVEIGVFGGRSLIPMAMACKANGHGKVIGIDPWTKEAAAEGYSGDNAKWWAELDMEKIYDTFLADVKRHGVEEFVTIVRKKSDDVESVPDVIDVFHCDGQHTDQAVRDVERFASRVRVGGFCITDDDNWVDGGGGPQQAVKRLMEIGFVPLYKCGTGTAFQRFR